MARHRLSWRLQDDRSLEHYSVGVAARGEDRRGGESAIRLRRQHSRQSGRSRKHALSGMSRDAHRALRLSDSRVQFDAGRRLPFVRHPNPRPVERRVYRTANGLSHSAAARTGGEPMIRDLLGRTLSNLRLSVTDRCNLRCSYCMPEAEYVWLPRQDILQFEEMSALVDVFARAGVDRIRLTGGEPLLRRDLPALISMLARKPAIRDLALTTNGVMLADQASALHGAGLHRLTVSLDTLRADRFRALTRFDFLAQVLTGIEAAVRCFGTVKLDSVMIRGTNDDELVP